MALVLRALEALLALVVLHAHLGIFLALVGDALEPSIALLVVQALEAEGITVLLQHHPKVPKAA